MKKIITLVIILMLSAPLFGQKINILTVKGELISGDVIGTDDVSVFVKTADGNAKTVRLDAVKKVFDAVTTKDITVEYVKAGIKHKAAGVPAQENAAASATAQPAVKEQQLDYITAVKNSGTIKLGNGDGPFVRTVPKYFDFGIAPMLFNFLMSGDNKRMKRLLLPYNVNAGGYTYDDGTLMLSAGFSGFAYLRPIDGFAVGAFYGFACMNQNLSVFSGGENWTYIDMPLTDYGVLIKLIPVSTAVAYQGGELAENFQFAINLKFGEGTLGSVFGNASQNGNSWSPSNAINLSASAPYYAVELSLAMPDQYIQFDFGYQYCYFDRVKADKGTWPIPGYLSDAQGYVPFSAQGLYLDMAILF
jgi:hypothetical protein